MATLSLHTVFTTIVQHADTSVCIASKEFDEHAWIPSLACTVTIHCNNKLELVLRSRIYCSNTPCMLACYWPGLCSSDGAVLLVA